ncbi:MAG: M16 family metallopeptidase, partial [Verrucomicrobiota bacterium]
MTASPPIPALPLGVLLHRLPNGLELILREDRSAPVVSAQAWCRAGSIDEGAWLGAGLSHVLEHMLFKGTTTRGAGRIDQEVQAAGGYMNAYTSFDRTVYHINVPNTGAAVALDILADILQHATLPADELASELDVIRREMAMGNDDPGRRASRRLFETAYTRSPYRYPVIGLPDLFNRLTRENLAAYYAAQYAPNNCFLVVVGDFRAPEVIAQLEKAFAGSPARPVPAVVLPSEPRQTAAREHFDEAPVELAHLHLAWHVPDLRHPDVPLLDVLATLLGSGRSSRLYQVVREQAGLVHSVSAWVYSPG